MSNSARPIQVGDRIRDNDPRFQKPHRVLRVLEVLPNGVRVENEKSRRVSELLMHFIHTDDKPRRTGFSLITEPSKEAP
jgi:hypothetical protein